MSKLSDHLQQFRTAIESTEIETAISAYDAVAQASAETLLSELATAVQEQRYTDAEMLVAQLARSYENRRQSEAVTTARVEAVQTANETAVQRVQDLSNYLGEVAETNLQRAEVLASVQSFLSAQDGQPESTASAQSAGQSQPVVVETIEQTRRQEQTFSQRQSTVKSELTEESVPPALAIVNVTQDPQTPVVGTPFTVSVNVENVGGAAITNVTVEFVTQAGLSSGESPLTLGEIAGGKQKTQTVEFTSQSAGTYSVEIIAAGSDGTSGFETFTVTIPEDSEQPPSGPEQRVLRITGRSSPEELTQNDVSNVITLFNRNEMVNDISITQNDISNTITLFERN